ncbi:MAG: hypothetical protein U0514_04375 [Candidatus Andersenbacteria bacterium]
MTLTGDASCNVTLSPCSVALAEAGVRYVAFVGPLPRHIECLREITTQPANDVRIFARR